MNNPTSFETSWSEAEKAAFAHLCTATGAEAGKGAFVGKNPGVVNAWHFSGLTLDAGDSGLIAPDLHSLAVPCFAECMFSKREACQTWAMRIIGACPLCNAEDTNLALLRVRTVSEIQDEPVAVANEQAPITVYVLRIVFDLAFATGGKANMAG